jgi:hypothetical protein
LATIPINLGIYGLLIRGTSTCGRALGCGIVTNISRGWPSIFMLFSRVVRLLFLAGGFVAPWLFLSPLSDASASTLIPNHSGADKVVCDSRVPSHRALARSGFLRRTRVVVRDRLSLGDRRHSRVLEDDDDTAIQTAAATVGDDHQRRPAALEPAGMLQIQDFRLSSHGGGGPRSPRGPPSPALSI